MRTTTICVQNGREACEENLKMHDVESEVFPPLLKGGEYELVRRMLTGLESKYLLQDHIEFNLHVMRDPLGFLPNHLPKICRQEQRYFLADETDE